MPQELSELMRTATDGLRLPPGTAERVIVRRRQRRRRRLLGAAAVAAVTVAAAVSVPLLVRGGTGASDLNRLVPVRPPSAQATPAVLASVDGIDVTYLPAGFKPTGALGLDAMRKENGHTSISQYYRPASQPYVSGTTPEMSMAVQRGLTLNLDAFAASSKGSQESWLTIRGHRALLQTLLSAQNSTPNGYELTWVEQPQLTITLFAESGVTLADVRQVADGLVVHQRPSPPDKAIATSAVTQAVTRAFSGDATDALDAIEHGQQLRAAFDELAREQPTLMQTVRPTSIAITFVGDDRAVVALQLSYDAGDGRRGVGTQVTVKRVGDRWLVDLNSYCGVVAIYLPRCPAP